MYQLVPLNNQFLNLEVLEEENLIKKYYGFSGSNATLLKGKHQSFLFTDKRYELQAKQETNGKNIEVIFDKLSLWLLGHNPKDKIYYNPWCHSIEEVKKFPKNFISKAVEPQYKIDRCPFEYEVKYAGASAEEKVKQVLEFIKSNNLDAYLVADASNLSWVLNLRSDILPHTPVYRAFATIDKEGVVHVFNHPKQIKKYKRIGLDERYTPDIFKKYIKKYISLKDTFFWLRAKKNDVEIKGFTKAHQKDGIAITKLLYWIYKNYKSINEYEVSQKLLEIRKKQKDFYKESFGSIVAMNKNAALPHYQPQAKKSHKLENGLLLLDVGAHYFGGTTDMSRTIALGAPTSEMKKHYTLVLKGHINLATQQFSDKTASQDLDILARAPLFNEGLDYNHGTGHGVANFLSVHEAPFISRRASSSVLLPNMITSIEPGVYFEGKYGIRIENLVKVIKYKNNFLGFEALTVVPLDSSLIDINLLSEHEKQWVFKYQQDVYKKLEKHLDENEKNWLKSYISFNIINIKS